MASLREKGGFLGARRATAAAFAVLLVYGIYVQVQHWSLTVQPPCDCTTKQSAEIQNPQNPQNSDLSVDSVESGSETVPRALSASMPLPMGDVWGDEEDFHVTYEPHGMREDGIFHATLKVPRLHGARHPLFFCKAQGPTTMLACQVTHDQASNYTLAFRPAEVGHHQVHVRLEYENLQDGVRGSFPVASDHRLPTWYWESLITPEQLIATPMLLFILPGSPFQVPVEPGSLRPAPDPLPRCSDFARDGYWVKEIRDPTLEPLLSSNMTIKDACPADCRDPYSIVCEPSIPTGRVSLHPWIRGQRPPWFNYGRWSPYDCELHRFTLTDANKCLQGRRIAYVGDSVTMAQCVALQCALHPGGCFQECCHRDVREPCFESQQLEAAPAVCISPEHFFGPSPDRLPQGETHETAFGPVEANGPTRAALWNANQLKEEQRQENMREVRKRHQMGGSGAEDVVVISVGLHDATLEWLPWFRDSFRRPTLEGGAWGEVFESLLRSDFGTVVVQTQVAIHKWVADTMNCSDLYDPADHKVNCIRMDFDPKVMLNHPRILKVNEFIRAQVERLRPKYPHKRLILVDQWKVSQTREDNTLWHSDQTHPCDEVYKEMNQVLLNSICPDV